MTRNDCTALRSSTLRSLVAATGLLTFSLVPASLQGQDPAPQTAVASVVQPPVAAVPLPDAPDFSSSRPSAPEPDPRKGQATQQSAAVSAQGGADKPSKRILGIIPNYRSVGIDAKLPPQTVGEKFKTSLQDTFDIGAFELAVAVSLEEYATVDTPEFHRGAVAYGRYFWHAFSDQSIENELVEFIVPSITREDTRYYTLGRGGFAKRSGYALTRIFVVRSDSGKQTFNFGEIVGAGAAAGISSTYYPASDRTTSKILTQYALNLGIDDASFFVREFDNELTNLVRKHPHAQTAP